jgi:hypothetical protein
MGAKTQRHLPDFNFCFQILQPNKIPIPEIWDFREERIPSLFFLQILKMGFIMTFL